jgi:hypothetical protein
MRRVLFSAGLGLTICAGLISPAGAQRVGATDRQPVTAEAQPVEVRPVEVRPADDEPDETLRLSCNGRTTDSGRSGVACTWSATTQRAAAGYRLVRTDGDTRTTVFRTRDLTQTSAVDGNIRLGVTYGYSILVVNEQGETIGSGGPVRAGVKAPDPELEVLTLRCEAADDVVAARCTWRPTTSEAAVGYQLWRVVNRGERELVWRGGLDQTAVRDDLSNTTRLVRYAVLAVDAQGGIVGQSRPVALRFDDGPTDRDVDRSPVRLRSIVANTYR